MKKIKESIKKYSVIYIENSFSLKREVFSASDEVEAVEKAFKIAYAHDKNALEKYLVDLEELRDEYDGADDYEDYLLAVNDLLADPYPAYNYLVTVVDLEEHKSLIVDCNEFFLQ